MTKKSDISERIDELKDIKYKYEQDIETLEDEIFSKRATISILDERINKYKNELQDYQEDIQNVSELLSELRIQVNNLGKRYPIYKKYIVEYDDGTISILGQDEIPGNESDVLSSKISNKLKKKNV